MKRDGLVLVAFGFLVVCVLAYSVVSRPFTPADLAAVPTPSSATEAKASPQDFPLPTPSPEAIPQGSNEPMSIEPVLKELIDVAAPALGSLVTKPDKCVFLGPPYRLAFLDNENLVLMNNLAGVRAFDITSGKQIWHRYLDPPSGGLGAIFGQRQVLVWSEQEVFLLDAATGRETWARRDDRCGPMETAILSPDESQVAVVCKQGCILYAVADRSQHVLPRPTNAWLTAWLPSNKTLFFAQRKGLDDDTVERLLLMDTDSGVVTTGCETVSSWEERLPMLSALGQFAEAAEDGETGTALEIRDARTGKVLREFKGIPGRTTQFFWLEDARRLLSLTADRKQARVVDAETGMVQFSLSREGHRFSMYKLFEDASANAWVFSQDEANNWYVWPLAPDGAPRRVLDGSRIAASYYWLCVSDPCYVLTHRAVEDSLWKHTAYALEGMQKIGEWNVHVREAGWGGPNVNKVMTHYVHFYAVDKAEWSRPQNMAFGVYAQDKETPVYTGRGRPMAVSPDAKYLAVQSDEITACLYDVETHGIVGRFSAPPRENNNYVHMKAAFSDDGKRVVVNTTESIEVMDLTEGYRQWPMDTGGNGGGGAPPCLSPDGSRVLCGGNGRARLFDADTGVLLHTFEETEHFANPYGQGDGFWNRLASSAQDWVGTITDKFKSGGFVDVAFTDGGARVITHAVGQIIRVWDAGSGELLHTMHTGLPEKRNRVGYMDNRIVLSTTGRFAFCYNPSNFGTASLWSMADGVLQRRYQLPERATGWAQAAPTDDGTAVYITIGYDLYRWPGVPIRGN